MATDFSEISRIIDESTSISDLYEKGAMPSLNFGSSFYFVSYSHADYKRVYKDLFALQSEGVGIWFDKGMVPGRDWTQVAENFIGKFACKAILLYFGKTSFTSQAVLDEVLLAVKYDKPVVPIVLDADILEDEDILTTYAKHFALSPSERKKLEKVFPKRALWIDVSAPASAKVNYFANLVKLVPPIASEPLGKNHDLVFLNEDSLPEKKLLVATSFADKEATEASLPTGTRIISRVLFANAPRLGDIDLSEVNQIEDLAFYRCAALKEADLSSACYIGDEAFRECASLENVVFPSQTPYQNDGKWFVPLCEYEIKKAFKAQDIPYIEKNMQGPVGGKIFMGNAAFSGCSSLKEVVLGGCFSYVANHGFAQCENLVSVHMPAGVHFVGKGAFQNDQSLQQVRMKKDVYWNVYFLDWCFNACPKLTDFDFPENTIRIGNYAFTNTGLRNLTLPPRLKSLGQNAFSYCLGLESVEIPASLSDIPSNCFEGCASLKRIEFSPRSGKPLALSIAAFRHCKGLQSIKLPTETVAINDYAFDGCAHLKAILIQEGAEVELMPYAFAGLPELKHIFLEKGASLHFTRDLTAWETADFSEHKRILQGLLCFYSETPIADGHHWGYVNGKVTIWSAEDEQEWIHAPHPFIAGKEDRLLYRFYQNPAAKAIVVWIMGSRDEAILDAIREKAGSETPFSLLAVFVGGSAKYLSPFPEKESGTKEALASLEKLIQKVNDAQLPVGICGDELRGLFALWAGFETDVFSSIVAISPSLYFKEWLPYCQSNKFKAKAAYININAKEGNRPSKAAEDALYKTAAAIRASGATVTALTQPAKLTPPRLSQFCLGIATAAEKASQNKK